MRFESKEAAETALREWAATNARRDQMVTSAREVGVSKNRIHTLTGIARTTIDRILEDTMDEYALCWESAGSDSAWVIRVRKAGGTKDWDLWLSHPDMIEGEVEYAKQWAAERLTSVGFVVEGWKRDEDGDWIPQSA